jgi:hypothetical protein
MTIFVNIDYNLIIEKNIVSLFAKIAPKIF